MAENLFEKQREELLAIKAEAMSNLYGAYDKVRGAQYAYSCAKKKLREERNLFWRLQRAVISVGLTGSVRAFGDEMNQSKQKICEQKATLKLKKQALLDAQFEHKKASNYLHAVQTLLGEDLS